MSVRAVLLDVGRVLINPREEKFQRTIEEVRGKALAGGVALLMLAKAVLDAHASLQTGASRAILIDHFGLRPESWALPAAASLPDAALLVAG